VKKVLLAKLRTHCVNKAIRMTSIKYQQR